MLIAVAGSSGLADVVGVSSTDRTALFQVAGSRASEHVVLLTPRHAASTAREQAHVLVAAAPRTPVCVLSFDHHALSLTLVAAAVLAGPLATAPRPDPGAVIQLLHRSLARTRSLVWHPRVWRLAEPVPTLGQLVSGLGRRSGFFLELGTGSGLLPGRAGSPCGPHDRLFSAGGASPALAAQLGAAQAVPIPVTVDERRPYATRGSVELSVLVTATHPPLPTASCPTCSAGLVSGGCLFCGHGPRMGLTASRSTTTRPTTDQGELVAAAGAPTPGGGMG